MNKEGPRINHLALADDTIIFSSGASASLQLIFNTLSTYEKASGQSINMNKSCFSLALNASSRSIRKVGRILNMRYDKLPMKYLGCPIYAGKKKIEFFSGMVTKVINKIRGCHLKFLSSGGKAILIRHVLQALNVHTWAVVHPPKGTIESIETYIARFF
ncbi:uncharacterized protein LOC132057883 [Lycium ferocissimum]|uniref:uncharacterized protein LOC132057883 n=1 Tax=Lycium ferocissimum TaxID=112874 RepID=UPI0028158A6A|nr:uncharacterized protein LOC132057883 [Lycium ferocissimum]